MKKTSLRLVALAFVAAGLTACGEEKAGIEPRLYTDSLFAVMKADRTNYTKMIVQRLGPAGADVINPAEHWQDLDNGAPLPAQTTTSRSRSPSRS